MKHYEKEFKIGYFLDIFPRLARYIAMLVLLIIALIGGNEFNVIFGCYILIIILVILITDFYRMKKYYNNVAKRESLIRYGRIYLERKRK